MDLPTLLGFVKQAGGSDLHLSAGAPLMARIHGEMRTIGLPGLPEGLPLSAEDVRELVYAMLNEEQRKRLAADRELDCALSLGPLGRYRANVFVQERGLGSVFRVISTQIRTCDELGLPPAIKALAELEKGLVLVTGPTGSGKSTTLAALVDLVNRARRGHIITVEDPIEFVHAPRACMVNQREVGSHTNSFSNALRGALREDPDVILVGEMRDLDTISLAITAAETGHLVFGTLHTASAAKTVDRIINVFPAGEQAQIRTMLAESLQAVVAQVLLPKRGGGRVAAHEILIANTPVRAMIRDGKTHQILSVLQTGSRRGMQSLEQSISRLVAQGLVEGHVAAHKLAALGLKGEEDAGSAAHGRAEAEAAPPPPAAGPAPIQRGVRADEAAIQRLPGQAAADSGDTRASRRYRYA